MKLVEPPPAEAAYLSLPSRDAGGERPAPRAAGRWALRAGTAVGRAVQTPAPLQTQPDPPPFTPEMPFLGSSLNAKGKIGLLQRLCDTRHDSRYVVLFRHAVCN